ncbi:MAG: sigma-70 family RNA polymerase sigma factor [Ruminococcaceae bacterium]|nr:sigma-70 family RNA polymerase sigma factor [Oscillospiraceae bacterium]
MQMNGLDSKEALVKLIIQAQEGSASAYEELLCRYRPLIESSVYSFVSHDTSLQDAEDLLEEARHIFLSAITSYDLSREGVEFGLYAKICLKNGLISELRRQQHRHRLGVVSLADGTEDIASIADADLSSRLVEEEDFRQLYRKIREHLSDLENRVWWMYVAGATVADIAKTLGKDEKSVHNAIYRIRAKLKRLLVRGEGKP